MSAQVGRDSTFRVESITVTGPQRICGRTRPMLHFYRFSPDVPSPEPARETYHKRQPGKGWPEECPPMRAANSFGWDLLNPTDLRFRQVDGKWTLETPATIE